MCQVMTFEDSIVVAAVNRANRWMQDYNIKAVCLSTTTMSVPGSDTIFIITILYEVKV